MIAAVLAFLALGVTILGGINKIVAADQRVGELIDDLTSAIEGLNEAIEAVETNRARESRQATEDLEAEKQRILAEQEDVVEDLERDIRQRGEQNGLAIEDIERQVEELHQNRDAALARAAREQEQAEAVRTQTVTDLAERVAAGDIEATRRINQLISTRDQFLAQTKDQAILDLNRSGQQLEYATTRAGTQAALQVSEATARQAGSAVRRTGTPLLAIRQVEMLARTEQRETVQEGRYRIIGQALGVGQRVETSRTETEQNVEDVMAQNALQDMQLEQERRRAELSFAHTYANLEASKADIEREAAQGEAALEAQRKAEALDYAQDIENLEDAAADEQRRLQQELDDAIREERQTQEDIQDQADILTQQYRRQITDAERHRTNLITNRTNIVLATALGTGGDILGAIEGFLDTLPVA